MKNNFWADLLTVNLNHFSKEQNSTECSNYIAKTLFYSVLSYIQFNDKDSHHNTIIDYNLHLHILWGQCLRKYKIQKKVFKLMIIVNNMLIMSFLCCNNTVL